MFRLREHAAVPLSSRFCDVCRRKTLSECATRLIAELDKEVARLPEPTTLAQKIKRQLFCTRGEEVTADLLFERGEQMLDEAQKLYRSVLQKREELAAEVVADLGMATAHLNLNPILLITNFQKAGAHLPRINAPRRCRLSRRAPYPSSGEYSCTPTSPLLC